MGVTRQLAAIMFTDIVGYTALMGEDEQKAFEILRINRGLQKPLIEQYGGKWIKELGDGILASFPTVTDAVLCATVIQKNCNENNDFKLRIGIHQGEVVFEDGDVFGDGVNIASRLQSLAPVGGIWISEAVHHNVFNKKEIQTRFVREEILKNVKEPVRIYEITTGDAAFPVNQKQPVKQINVKNKSFAATNRKPVIFTGIIFLLLASIALNYRYFSKRNTSRIESIAVMPFVNESRIEDMEYLSDGMTETLINSLSGLREVSVKARSSVFRYKGRAVDLQKIGNELSVQAILNGRVAQRGDNIHLSLELVDVRTGDQIWGEQYNRTSENLLTLQSEIAQDVSNKLITKLSGIDQKRVTKNYTENTEAYQFYLKGRYHWNKRTETNTRKSIDYFRQAINKDPTYSLAYAGLADAYMLIPIYTNDSPREAYEVARAAALKALQIDETLAEAHSALAVIKSEYDWNFAEAEKTFKRAIELNPNYATARQWYAEYLLAMQRQEEALAQVKKATEVDPLSLIINTMLGVAYREAGKDQKAVEQLKKTIELDPNFARTHEMLAETYEHIGLFEEAILEYGEYLKLTGVLPQEVAKFSAVLKEAYKKAGAKAYWKKLAEWNETWRTSESIPQKQITVMAGIYGRAGEKEQALKLLEKGYEQRNLILWRLQSSDFDAIRSSQLFKDLLRRIGLP